MSAPSKIQHILLFPVPAYGHLRPLCALAGKLAAEGANIVITILVTPNWLKSAQSDIAAQFPGGHEASARIRIVSLFESNETDLFALMPLTIQHYPAAYETLHRGSAINCATTGIDFAAVPPPSAIIMDVFALPQLYATRSVSGNTVPIFMFVAGNAGALIHMFCPESMGGKGDFGAKIDAEALRLGKKADEIGDQIFNHTDGTVIRIPGIPAMYDYETLPQIILDGPVAALHKGANEMLKACDGIFLNTAPAYDRETLVAFETWLRQSLNKPIYVVGPLLPPGYGTEEKPTFGSLGDLEIASFLDSMKSKHGERSVLFISFGSVFWPKVQEQLDYLVDTLIAKEFPFILCHASPAAIVPAALSQKIKSSGIGIATPWAPQQYILTNRATGWFLTHCGHGGVLEALSSGVPMICWPFQADQPVAAVHLTQTLNVAFHLMEVRTAKGLQPLHSGYVPQGTRAAMQAEFRDIIDQCRGETGKEKRKNARAMQVDLAEVWKAGGSASLVINQFFAEHLDSRR
ncbi:UDP-Glycosyltransferase/glycogen phosphorylase [Mycena galopus ATCC 62051]|nr:UDP-Glycosyltransferase/glycogen phosphorylase [Mycena galopus ATCC 62051]